MTRSQYMYAWSDYKKAWQQKFNLYLRISAMPSFVFLCVGVPTLTLTLPLILNILSFVFLVCRCPRPHPHPHPAPHTQYSIFCFFLSVGVSALIPHPSTNWTNSKILKEYRTWSQSIVRIIWKKESTNCTCNYLRISVELVEYVPCTVIHVLWYMYCTRVMYSV